MKSHGSSVEAKVPQAGDLEPLSAFQRAVIAGNPELAQPLKMREQRMIWTQDSFPVPWLAGWHRCFAQTGLSQCALFLVFAALCWHELDIYINNMNLKSCVVAEQG